MLVCFGAQYEVWREFLSEYLGIDLKAAKQLLIRLVQLGRPAQDIPFLWELFGRDPQGCGLPVGLG